MIEVITDIGYNVNKRYRLIEFMEIELTTFPISDTQKRMGRPPMNVKPILVRLPEEIPDRIDALVGKNRRAEFIREAVESELKRREKAAKAEK